MVGPYISLMQTQLMLMPGLMSLMNSVTPASRSACGESSSLSIFSGKERAVTTEQDREQLPFTDHSNNQQLPFMDHSNNQQLPFMDHSNNQQLLTINGKT